MGLLDKLFGGSRGSQSSSQYVNPAQTPFLSDVYNQAQTTFGSPSVAGAQEAAGPLNLAAGGQYLDTLGGAYMPGSEQFGNTLQAMYNQIRPSLDSQFASTGRYGSGLHRIGAEDRMAQIGAGLYGDERNRQMEAARNSPQFAALLQQFPWMAAQNYADVVGPPTVLGESQGDTRSFGGIIPGLSKMFSFTKEL